jgi:hypothetical protein
MVGGDSVEMFAGNSGAPVRQGQPGQPGGSQAGNHALQDYQMQLMLLEQQNKKRLLMARQEQDSMSQPPHVPGSVGQPSFPPAMSPSGSRAGPSPNPADQMKRGTPKLGQTGLPGSPMPDGMPNRQSPIPNFDPSQMPPGMGPQGGFYPQMGPNGMRPPSSHPNPNFQNQGAPLTQEQLAQMARQRSAGQIPNGGMWAQQPQMMQQNPGQPPVQMGTPRQGNAAMPPPPAPQAAGEQQRTQPPSPNPQPAAPPTPSQQNRAGPKKKKESEPKKVMLLTRWFVISGALTFKCRKQTRRAQQRQLEQRRLQNQKMHKHRLHKLPSHQCIRHLLTVERINPASQAASLRLHRLHRLPQLTLVDPLILLL